MTPLERISISQLNSSLACRREAPPAETIDFNTVYRLFQGEYEDVWGDADMRPVLRYLRGNRHLNLPEGYKLFM